MNKTIGKFNPGKELILKRAPNGGYIVSAHNGELGIMPDVIGAYGSAEEMIAALEVALTGEEE